MADAASIGDNDAVRWRAVVAGVVSALLGVGACSTEDPGSASVRRNNSGGSTASDAGASSEGGWAPVPGGGDSGMWIGDGASAPPADAGGDAGACATNPCPANAPVCTPTATAPGYQCAERCAGVTCPQAQACDPATGKCFDPCATANCQPTEVCIATVHGQPSGVCVDGHQCDCGNCGNCGAGGSYVGMQAFCGNPAGAPATLACTKKCASGGDGCIPFGQDTAGNPAWICWGAEGCFGL